MSKDSTNWIGNADKRALVNEDNGQILAIVYHDGHGRFQTTVYASILSSFLWSELYEKIQLSWNLREYPDARWSWLRHIRALTWRGFPRCRLPLGDVKAYDKHAFRTDIAFACLLVDEIIGRAEG